MENIKLISIRFDKLGATDNEIKIIEKSLGELAPTRSRMQFVERGGDEIRLWITVYTQGLNLITDAAAALVVQAILEKSISKIKDYQKSLKVRLPTCLILEMDDVDVHVNVPADYSFERLNGLIVQLHEALKKKRFKDNGRVQKVLVPFHSNGVYWEHNFYENSDEFNHRFWGIDYVGAGFPERVYDSKNDLLFSVEYPDFAPRNKRLSLTNVSELAKKSFRNLFEKG